MEEIGELNLTESYKQFVGTKIEYLADRTINRTTRVLIDIDEKSTNRGIYIATYNGAYDNKDQSKNVITEEVLVKRIDETMYQKTYKKAGEVAIITQLSIDDYNQFVLSIYDTYFNPLFLPTSAEVIDAKKSIHGNLSSTVVFECDEKTVSTEYNRTTGKLHVVEISGKYLEARFTMEYPNGVSMNMPPIPAIQ